MSSLLIFMLLAGGGGLRPPEDPTLLVALQIPAKVGDPAQLSHFDWATGHELWSGALPLPNRVFSGGSVLIAGPDLWVLLTSKPRGDLLVAVDLATGRERFRVAGHYLGAPSAEGSKAILIHQGGDGVVAIDPATGGELWRRRDLVAIPDYSGVVGNRMLLALEKDYLALDPVTGEDRWKIPQECGYPYESGGLLWTWHPAPAGLDPKTGAERRRLRLPEGCQFRSYFAGKACVGYADRLETLRLPDGAPLWSLPLEKGEAAISVWETHGRIQVLLHPSNRCLCLEARTGRQLCEFTFPPSDSSSSSVHNGRVGVRWFDRAPNQGYLHLWLYDVLAGRVLWKGDADDDWGSKVRDEVYVAKGRDVVRVDVDAGGARWTVSLPEPPRTKLAGPGCTVVACADRLLSFSAVTGKPLWDTPLPQSPAPLLLGAAPLR